VAVIIRFRRRGMAGGERSEQRRHDHDHSQVKGSSARRAREREKKHHAVKFYAMFLVLPTIMIHMTLMR
jgi:hypothetical protein